MGSGESSWRIGVRIGVTHPELQAEILFGLKEPLLSWLRTANAEAVAALAGSPTLVYEPRLPEPGLDRILDAYEGTSVPCWLLRILAGS